MMCQGLLSHSHIILPLLLTMRRCTSETAVGLHNKRLLDNSVSTITVIVTCNVNDMNDRIVRISVRVVSLALTACSQ